MYYIREKSVKSLKMKYKDLSEFAKAEEIPETSKEPEEKIVEAEK